MVMYCKLNKKVKYGYPQNTSVTVPLLPEETKYDFSTVQMDSDYSPQLQKSIIKSSRELETLSVQASDLILEEQVGAGSSGQVYRGTFMGSTVAVKRCLIVDLLDDPLKYFMQETNMMSILRHPNVVKFYGASLRPPYFYIITEFCDKGSVDPLYKKVSLTLQQKLKMMIDTALGMLYLSKNHIIHRDLKLSNLLVDGEFNVKVGDFGSSRAIKNKTERMTQISTIDTSAPEVLKNATYTPSSDIFSFGICLWQLMFELPLYPEQNVYEISTNVIQGTRPPIPKNDTKIPKAIVTLMQKCWDPSPNKRPKWEEIITILQTTKKELDKVPSE